MSKFCIKCNTEIHCKNLCKYHYEQQKYLNKREYILSKAKQYYQENKEDIKEYTAKYAKENKEISNLHKRKYVDQNPEKVKNSKKLWKKKNPEKLRADASKRRAIKLKRTPPWADLKAIEEFYKGCPEGYEVDHIVPLQGKLVSGLHVLNNLQYLLASENRKKSNKFEVG